jgi:hypothetical protein
LVAGFVFNPAQAKPSAWRAALKNKSNPSPKQWTIGGFSVMNLAALASNNRD